MPFSKYLQTTDDGGDRQGGDYNYHDPRNDGLGVDASTFSSPVQFQVPQFMLGGPPTLAFGGGAEVLPAGMVNAPGSLASSWFSNNGFYVDHDPSSASCSQSQSQPQSTSKLYAPQPQSYPQLYQQTQAHGIQHIQHTQHAHRHSMPSVNPHANVILQDRPPPNSGPPSPVLRPSYDPTRYRNNTYPPISNPVDPISFDMRAPLESALSSGVFPSISIASSAGIGLPLYSATGFDLLSLLARVAARPNPTIALGPVDMTCSFTVVDVRRYDFPIVYASPSFYTLTGYQEHEVIGRNCRFLQSPNGRVEKGEERKFTAPESVAYLKKNLVANKECQTTITNYRKDGEAFINLLTVIPLYGGVNNNQEERDDVVYHVGFQVDLTNQPTAILQKVRDGSYFVNYSSNVIIPPPAGASARRASGVATHAVSKDLKTLLASEVFVNSLPLTSSTNAPLPASGPMDSGRQEGDTVHPLNLVLLESTPDFIHVLSLKGSFLYVAPAVRKVLGYEPDELVGKFISDYCHPADVVPLMRELKESSTGQPPLEGAPGVGGGVPKMVDLLFRAQAKWGEWVWVECRGRLHVEPGKGRKAIVLSGRVRELPTLSWGMIGRAGGLTPLVEGGMAGASEEGAGTTTPDKEFWGMLSSGCTILVLGAAVKEILGWSVGELIGRTIGDLVVSGDGARDDEMARLVEGSVGRIAHGGRAEPASVACWMSRKEGAPVRVNVVFYPSRGSRSPSASPLDVWIPPRSTLCPVVCQVRIDDGQATSCRSMTHSPKENVFAELTTATSWQYELQQLKFANQRILEEIEGLEEELGRDDAQTPSPENERSLQSSWPSSEVPDMYEHVRVPMKRSHNVLEDHHGDQDYAWNSQMQYASQQHLYMPSSRSHYTSNVRAEAGHGHGHGHGHGI
ncbi:hypothetical protein NEOLEDRAFT_1142888 [Neolentinus lepideus HHB14362 ss-1]|uniref:PAS domain-containing protein n=1 Tax=Neolentinus lepideus HHB14362 ss-1 TaxID=1314782 RepID=A0A165MUC3_9AGAM|nr:hypothetical protein NEOLEDRAFT_1142888 [Neolentinus lepideus HHB14362 ss-1]